MSTPNTKIGLYFGSFNPVHNGHLITANFVLEETDLHQIWFVMTPQNPDKKEWKMVDEQVRFKILKEAVEGYSPHIFRACDVELDMERPNYTYLTLRKLRSLYPDKDFSVIIGGDNYINFYSWDNIQELVQNHTVIVCPRHKDDLSKFEKSNQELQKLQPKNIQFLEDVPNIGLSSTLIRKRVINGKSIKWMVPDNVMNKYIIPVYGNK